MRMEEYKAFMKNKTLLNVAFSAARNQDEIFCAYDEDGVELRLPYKEYFMRADKEQNKLQTASVIRNPKNVIVKSVDMDKRIVTVSYLGALAMERQEAQKKIDTKIDKGEDVRVRGIIIDVRGSGKQSFAVIRFRDSNLKGLLWCNRWSPTYIADLKDKAAVGMEVEVDIVGYNKSKVEPRCRYVCARDVVIGDIWEGIEKKYHKDDILNVKCEGPWVSFFAGSIAGEAELPIRMLAPKQKEGRQPLFLVPGLTYQCIVIGVSEENHTFRVMPLRLCNAQPGVKPVVMAVSKEV